MEEIEKKLKNKWTEIEYVNAFGELVSMAGKINYIRLDGQDYSYFRMNPIVGQENKEFKLLEIKENPLYIIPPGSIQLINDNLTKRDLEMKCKEYTKSIKPINNSTNSIGFKIGKLEKKPTN
jgi:hypothetical protein